MNFHYLDLDDILTTGETLSCVLEMNIKGLGHLDPSTDDVDLKKGAKLELPFWLAQKLKNDEKNKVVTVGLPKPYRESYREMYKAEPQVVDLQSLGPNFYNLAMKMPLIDPVQCKDITASALQLYKGRFKGIMDAAQNASYKEKAACIVKFDNVERFLFEKGQESLSHIMDWEAHESERIATSHVVQRHGKRKRDASDH
ncbi:DNA replication complex GINS protein PSF3-like [Watersipora subatra]|uniref:DNA replication complex GINS protein PSF3-like n=1 Tax=Watersipora subatra TaxID=2589382 RepID=UPI00355BC5DE